MSILDNLRKQNQAKKSKAVEKRKDIDKNIQNEGLQWNTKKTTASEKPVKKQANLLGGVKTDEKEVASEIKRTAQAEKAAPKFSRGNGVDWRNHRGNNYVTRAWNQKSCNACVSFAVVAAMEAKLRIQTGRPNLPIALSEASMNFCHPGGNCTSGWSIPDGLKWAQTTGVVDEECSPWGSSGCNRCSNWQQRAFKIASFEDHRTTEERKAALEHGPCIGYMFAYADFLSYGGGIYRKTAGTSPLGFHAILVVGYDDGQQAWIVKNSMGRSWGDNGFGMIAYNDPNLMLDNAFPFYSIGTISIPGFFKNNKTGSGDDLTDLTSVF